METASMQTLEAANDVMQGIQSLVTKLQQTQYIFLTILLIIVFITFVMVTILITKDMGQRAPAHHSDTALNHDMDYESKEYETNKLEPYASRTLNYSKDDDQIYGMN